MLREQLRAAASAARAQIAPTVVICSTQGSKVGQVNGLSVSFVGSYALGHPTRITATTRLGDGEVLDIQREVEMGGPIHSKGVLILSSFLASRYPRSFGRPLLVRRGEG